MVGQAGPACGRATVTSSMLPAVVLTILTSLAALLALRGPGRVRRRLAQRLTSSDSSRPGRPSASDAGPNRAGHPGEGLADTAMMLELIGTMLDSGAGVGRSLQLVTACASPEYARSLRPVVSALAIGADWATAWSSSVVVSAELLELRDALGFAALTGAPSSAILYAQAARMRRERFRAAEKRAAALGVKLVIPLGLCSLPAFVCLGVVPVLLAMIPSGP